MQLFLYSRADDDEKRELIAMLTRAAPHVQPMVFNSLIGLSSYLTGHEGAPDIAIIQIRDQRDLDELQCLKPITNSIKMIMILPDRTRRTLEVSLKFFPRFLSYHAEDFSQLEMVIRKIVSSMLHGQTHASEYAGDVSSEVELIVYSCDDVPVGEEMTQDGQDGTILERSEQLSGRAEGTLRVVG